MPDSFLSRHRAFLVIGTVLGVVSVVVVVLTLQRPDPPTFAPSPVEPVPVGEDLVGPLVRTVDATASDGWTFFSFRTGAVVSDPGPLDWDLAFRRFRIIANGGDGLLGQGGIVDLGEVPFDSVRSLPADGYVPTRVRGDSVNEAIERWYSYSIFSHLLSPDSRVYGVRTADGRYAKMEVLGYYCPGAAPGCLTIRYVFQGDGSREVDPRTGAASEPGGP